MSPSAQKLPSSTIRRRTFAEAMEAWGAEIADKVGSETLTRCTGSGAT